ncbi:unnamed protein product [Blepharisma stoltei]|uniref:PA14 domain-containing protein n=1 Tax=Blepharisma stoltei TaxID=1481888 RepID=A0AAU9K562_9CILI|nr:unnamed protein product [Blepharisma stoltei]
MSKLLSFLVLCFLLCQQISATTLSFVSDGAVYTFQSGQKVEAVIPAEISLDWPTMYGSNWIWDKTDNVTPGVALFMRFFTVPGIPTKSYITISGDDNFTIFLNGRLVAMKSETSHFLTEIDMLSKTVQGDNYLHIIVDNNLGLGGLLFKAAIEY